MMRPGRVLRWALGLTGGALLLTAGAVYAASERRLARRYAVPALRLPVVTSDSAAVARGAHLSRAVMNCVLCHGEDLGGRVYDDTNAVIVVAGPNLTRGRGGRGAALTDADWVRALRVGARRDGTSMLVMPSEVFTHVSDTDLAALVAYARQVRPIDRVVPVTHYRPLGRALLAAGKLNLLVASKTPRIDAPHTVVPDTTAAYGRYLADIAGCRGCHGLGLSGGRVAGPAGLPPASNLTPDSATGIGGWREAAFVRAMREGRRPDGRTLDGFMPWRLFAHMTDAELHALWLYLRSVPARPFGHK